MYFNKKIYISYYFTIKIKIKFLLQNEISLLYLSFNSLATQRLIEENESEK